METAVDLATLDALFAAATPGEWKPRTMYSLSVVDAPGGTDTYFGTVWGSIVTCEETEQTDGEGRTWSAGGTAKANAALIAALHNAWPSLRRRLEIGDAAVALCEAEANAKAAGKAYIRAMMRDADDATRDRLYEAGKAARAVLDAARRRYEETCRAG